MVYTEKNLVSNNLGALKDTFFFPMKFSLFGSFIRDFFVQFDELFRMRRGAEKKDEK